MQKHRFYEKHDFQKMMKKAVSSEKIFEAENAKKPL